MVLVLRNTLLGGRFGGLQTSLGILTGRDIEENLPLFETN